MAEVEVQFSETDKLIGSEATPETAPEVQVYERTLAAVRAQRKLEYAETEHALLKRS